MSRPSPRPPSRSSGMFRTETERLPTGPWVRLLRWWIPLALCLVGVALMVADNFDTFGVSAFGAFCGAGSSTWLINWLWRIGISGDDERDREAKDRDFLARRRRWPSGREGAFFDEHGRWPEEDSAPRTGDLDHRDDSGHRGP